MAQRLGQEISLFCQDRDIETRIVQNDLQTKQIKVEPNLDLVIVVGGDGTLLSVARKIKGVPFLGINSGRLGFWTELNPENWSKGLDQILDGQFKLSPRLKLAYSIPELAEQGEAINDLVLHRTGLARLLELEVEVGAKKSFVVRADGVILFTPTGSTAYNLSAHGAICYPELRVFGINFICPFLSLAPKLLFPESTKLRVILHSDQIDAMLTVDGQKGIVLRKEVKIDIMSSSSDFILVQKQDFNFIDKLQEKKILE